VPVQTLLLVDRLGAGLSLLDREELLLLQVTLDVTLGPGLLVREVRAPALDLGEGQLAGGVEETLNPLDLASDPLRTLRHGLGVGEELLDVGNAVVLRVLQQGVLERAYRDSVCDDLLHLGVRQL